ncbi:MAG: hypothetical protein GY719_36395 [bacterium]|nr:hypothetical protein [bacterium]
MTDRHESEEDRRGEAHGGTVSEEDRALLAQVEEALARARELGDWWQQLDATGAYQDRFDLSTTHSRSHSGFGFFDEAEIAGQTMPIMGSVQEQLFDHPKAAGDSAAARERAAQWMNRQMREFVLRYFMRVGDFSHPEAFPGKNGQPPPTYLRPFSWYPNEERVGFGFEQMYYKPVGRGEPQSFAEEDRYAIVDLREIGTTYEWIVVKVDLFDFELVLAPLGESYPHGALPTTEPSYLVLSEPFIVDEENPEGKGEGEIGRYGFGCAFLPGAEESFLAHGLGRFDAAFESIEFRVGEAGEVDSRVVFVANRPRKAVNVSVDPVDWGFRMADRFSLGAASSVIEPMQKMWHRMPGAGGVDVVQTFINAANMVTSGGAARSLGLSRKQLHKNFLVAQFAQQYNLVAGSLAAWRQIPDWLDRDNLPDWALWGRALNQRKGWSS